VKRKNISREDLEKDGETIAVSYVHRMLGYCTEVSN
jgi:hypothetical protein